MTDDSSGLAAPTDENTGLLVPKEIAASHKDRLRGRLALMLFVLFALEVVVAMLGAIFLKDETNLRSILEIILPPTTALLGSVAGFYYGSEQK